MRIERPTVEDIESAIDNLPARLHAIFLRAEAARKNLEEIEAHPDFKRANALFTPLYSERAAAKASGD